MKSPKTNEQGWELVKKTIKKMGISLPELARRVGLTKQGIHQWKEVPLRFVVKVEGETGIPREAILPENTDIFRPSASGEGREETQAR